MTTGLEQTLLTAADVKQFHDQGYLGPFTLCSPEEMAAIRAQIDRDVLTTDGPDQRKDRNERQQSRHLDCRVIWELCSHPAIVERMAQIYGPDLVLWRSHMFLKEPGGKRVPWHQDLSYWPIEPAINITAWVAVDETTVANGCLDVIPGSHKACRTHIPVPADMRPTTSFATMADPNSFDVKEAVQLCMQPGQFVLFNEKTLHHSEINRSNTRRLGLAVRVTVPIVRVNHDELFPGHRNLMLRGEDRMGFNRIGQPPVR
ncbi:MAG: phytanoyl-CoA dioxygenase family protein [Planctomycetota bacterium]